MRIKIRSREGNLNLPIPTGLLLNNLTAALLPKVFSEMGLGLTNQQAKSLITAVNQFRKTHKGWVLVEVHSADGDEILIKL